VAVKRGSARRKTSPESSHAQAIVPRKSAQENSRMSASWSKRPPPSALAIR
jgi:hypothetical protein